MLDQKIITFLTVCETMNYTKAAEQLHITQPAVSQHIRGLEEIYGCRLFICRGRKPVLTDAGILLRDSASAMRSDEELLRRRITEGGRKEIPLHFGVTMTIGEYVIAAPLAAYLKKHPDTDVRMSIANTSELIGKMDSGELQFALVEGYFDRDRFASMTFESVPFVPVCAADHRLLCGKEVPVLKDLLGERLLLREPGSGTRDILEKQLAAAGLSLHDFSKTVEIGGMHAILQMLEADAGISFLYLSAAEKPIREGKLREIPLADLKISHDFSFVWKKDSIYGQDYRKICRELMTGINRGESDTK
jgi:DNA-binding transcriptional LysR family regulator